MEKLRQIIWDTDTIGGRRFDFLVQALILLSLVAYSCETLPNLDPFHVRVLNVLEIVIVAFFTVEYLLRVLSSNKRWSYVFSFLGLIDLLAILPFYLRLGVDLRSIRAFRFLRLIRILKLVRYSRAARQFMRAFQLARDEIVLFTAATMILLFMAAVGIHFFEHEAQPEHFGSVFHSLWWAVVTLTTVGYGDAYPITVGGKVFTALVVLVGLGIVAVPTGLVASAFAQAREEEKNEE